MKALESGAVWNSNRAGVRAGRRSPEKEEPIAARPPSAGKISPATKPAKKSSGKLLKFFEPMMAKLMKEPPAGDWSYEIKFDGYRALALISKEGVELLSRNNKDLAEKFPAVPASLRKLKTVNTVLDGEIVALGPKGQSSFQLLQSLELGQERPPLFFYVFDMPQHEGEDLRGLPVEERRARLEKMLKKPVGLIRFSETVGADGEALLKQARALGLEGVIGKRAGTAYETGRRSGAWIKLKTHREQEFVIGGYSDPEGGRKHFGALLMGVYEKKGRGGKELVYTGKVGTGFNDALLRTLGKRFRELEQPDCPFVNLPEAKSGHYGSGITKSEMKRCHWLKPALVAQVKFAEWTRDGKLRQPVFLGLREDKKPLDVGREEPADA